MSPAPRRRAPVLLWILLAAVVVTVIVATAIMAYRPRTEH